MIDRAGNAFSVPPTTAEVMEIPLFPLNAVLFPGGHLPLRIFEPRYLEMVSNCMKENIGFGICLISDGNETDTVAQSRRIGTLCEISYFNRQPDGLLGITASGKQRFQILSKRIAQNQLVYAQVSLLPLEPSAPIEIKFAATISLLESLFKQLGQPYTRMVKNYDCASWVSSRLCELLPIDLRLKQQFLELEDPLARINALWVILQAMARNKPDSD